MYFEEVDLCWQALIFGLEVYYAPKSIVYHKIDEITKNFTKKMQLMERNKLRTLLRNYEFSTLFRTLPNYIYFRIHNIYSYRLNKLNLPRILFIIYLKSFLWNLVNLKSFLKYRSFIQTNRTRNDKYLFKLIYELKIHENRIIQAFY